VTAVVEPASAGDLPSDASSDAEGVSEMLMGPMQPELGRERVADGIRRAQARRRSEPFVRARAEERRSRVRGAFQAMIAALRPVREPAPEPLRTAPVQTRC
jgi:hypothetical protein